MSELLDKYLDWYEVNGEKQLNEEDPVLIECSGLA